MCTWIFKSDKTEDISRKRSRGSSEPARHVIVLGRVVRSEVEVSFVRTTDFDCATRKSARRYADVRA